MRIENNKKKDLDGDPQKNTIWQEKGQQSGVKIPWSRFPNKVLHKKDSQQFSVSQRTHFNVFPQEQ